MARLELDYSRTSVFLDFDRTKREGYEQRARAAQGVVESTDQD